MLPTDLPSLAKLLGSLPGGDAPQAWYISDHPEVLKGYARYKADRKIWNDRLAELLALSQIKPSQAVIKGMPERLMGIVYEGTTPRWWRKTNEGYLVPRKRTREERHSEVRRRFTDLGQIPWVIKYLPGMPNTVLTGASAHIPQALKPAEAVLVFLGVNPDEATHPFEVGDQWTRLKLSTYHLLRGGM